MRSTRATKRRSILSASWHGRNFLPVDRQTRNDSNQKPEDPGPIANPAVREQLKSKWPPVLDEGISNLDEALQIDSGYVDAMAYINLLIRYRADLLDTPSEWYEASAQADEWMQKSLDMRKLAANSPPPSPPAPVSGAMRIGAGVLNANLIEHAEPLYPPLASQARISGSVVLRVTVGIDGLVKNLQLVSGHPLLVQPARDAVAAYRYKPTLLNGSPVEVASTVAVPFVLGP